MSSPFPLDAQSLVLLQTTISFITAPFNAPSYNFPLFLFGIYATDNTNSNEPLRLFSVLVGASGVLDIIWLIKTTDQSGFIAMLSFINLLLKAPTFFAILVALRHRGAGFSAGQLGGAASTGVLIRLHRFTSAFNHSHNIP
ncbi:hypothetical protein BOTBODRAFT_117503 [Botryobasidium botryosum FD-172 SS1]|uniref:Uncharacterized protein n=1 Tax=Botryobasidium botryosum (strain FD-172 SS1) TaxID=930990 RepID=A0A067MBF7_BOTB1|nr:hypothetical protein BOTBODRAFT_117503 [Botryobasidium botryosum FD-172 SS1]